MDRGHFLICTINLENGTYKWDEVSEIEGCIPYMGRENISIIDGKFYVPLCGSFIGIVNPDNYTAEILNLQDIFKNLSFYKIPIACEEENKILGEYKNFLILRGFVVYETNEGLIKNYKHLWIAFDTKTNKISQILEWDSLYPQSIVVKDKDGKELSKVETDKLIKNISKVYDVNGNSYLESIRFVDSEFIRFPYMNGY